MQRKEALEKLGLPSDASDEDAKKAFKKLAVKYHPDKNTENREEAEKKFKEINSAYQAIENPQRENSMPFEGTPFDPFSFFKEHIRQQVGVDFFKSEFEEIEEPDEIVINLELSFKESVLGSSKDISFQRNIACKNCLGTKAKRSKEKCDVCDGRGMKVAQAKNMVMQTSCSACQGLGKKMNKCESCNGKGISSEEKKLTIKIPGGITSGTKMRLMWQGHFVPKLGQQSAYINFIVKEDKYLSLREKDVWLSKPLDISLLEALEGTTKIIPTIYGDKEISIKSNSKNLDHITLDNLGVQPHGNQIVTLSVKYPEDTSKLINFLKENK